MDIFVEIFDQGPTLDEDDLGEFFDTHFKNFPAKWRKQFGVDGVSVKDEMEPLKTVFIATVTRFAQGTMDPSSGAMSKSPNIHIPLIRGNPIAVAHRYKAAVESACESLIMNRLSGIFPHGYTAAVLKVETLTKLDPTALSEQLSALIEHCFVSPNMSKIKADIFGTLSNMKIYSGFKIKATVTPALEVKFDRSQTLARKEFDDTARNCLSAGTTVGESQLNWRNIVDSDIEVSFV